MVSSNSRDGGMGRGEAVREEKEREHKELKQPKSNVNFLNLHILPISQEQNIHRTKHLA